MAARGRKARRGASAGASGATEVIANQVFLGLPWRAVRPRYERIIDRMRSKSPLSFVIVGRNDKQDAEDLFEIIKERIASSSYAIFDATGGNANVSLEYGYAEAVDIPRALYLSTHGAAKRAATDAPIIQDLAGKRRNQYKQEAALSRLLKDASAEHAYTIRFDRFLQNNFKRKAAGQRKRTRALALKIIHALDGVRQARRADIVQRLQADASRYSAAEVDDMLKRLHKAKLIRSQQGPRARVHIV